MAAAAMLMLSPEPSGGLVRGRTQIARVEMKGIEVALQAFRFDIGRYPTSDGALKALIQDPGNLKSWRGPYLNAQSIPRDPWGRPFIYRSNPKNYTYDLICYGQDGVPGGKKEDEDILHLNREIP